MSEERREYYRILDRLPLYHTAIPEPDTEKPPSDHEAMLVHMEGELSDAINKVFRADPVIGQALGLINRKIDMLGSMLPGQSAAEGERHVPTPVSLSGSGVAFDSDESFPVGTRRRLSLLLQPSQVPLQLNCTVMANEPSENEDQSRRIRLGFDEDDVAREQIIRYVVQRQGMRQSEMLADESGDSR
ncbi:PilZ domain-containing protein [Chromatocurvus halotolerans]|uniref:PilZ domain-containing protein n=1 Tax=Chromatocurvus halotolerans TaxID=1132028 RepID=UPI000E3EAEA5|nr:PilZ domain-containing protein [Chromatocurvus halotolerans]